MAFSDDSGGFAFQCPDAKFSIGSATWATRLSQLAKMTGTVRILTRALPDVNYIIRVLEKRPLDVWIVAHVTAHQSAAAIKRALPGVRIALHPDIGAKVALISPETVWLSSSDFGFAGKLESAIGLHSRYAHDRAVQDLFEHAWNEAAEVRS
ncbi:hypothetical protein [Pseudomonas sp. RIT-To-2]|uniref:hypothetical protein n=1 Tax=Pseudomonas sp. RIT-To-2 TaxID=3462541 RepID=UPI0024133AD8